MTSPLTTPLLSPSTWHQLQKVKSLGISYGIMWDVYCDRAIRTLSLTNIPRTKKKNRKSWAIKNYNFVPRRMAVPYRLKQAKTSSALPRLSTHYWWPANGTMTAQTSCGVASARGCQHPRIFLRNKKKENSRTAQFRFRVETPSVYRFFPTLVSCPSLFIKL